MIDFDSSDYTPITHNLAPYLEQSFLDKVDPNFCFSGIFLYHTELLLIIPVWSGQHPASLDIVYQSMAEILNQKDITYQLSKAGDIFQYDYNNGQKRFFCWFQLEDQDAEKMYADHKGNIWTKDELKSYNHIKDIPNVPKTTLTLDESPHSLIPNTTNRSCNNCYNETVELFHTSRSRYCTKCKI